MYNPRQQQKNNNENVQKDVEKRQPRLAMTMMATAASLIYFLPPYRTVIPSQGLVYILQLKCATIRWNSFSHNWKEY